MEKTILFIVKKVPKAELIISKRTTLGNLLSSANSLVPDSEIYDKILMIDSKTRISSKVVLDDFRNHLVYDIVNQGYLIYKLKFTKTQCLKINELRKAGYDHLEHWLQTPGNVYVGRRGRLFITEDGEKRVFHYPESRWKNPYPVEKGMSLEDSLKKYRLYLEENDKLQYLDELRGKTLGCFCKQVNGKIQCHAQILQELINSS